MPVYHFSGTWDWFAAANPEDAVAEWCDHHDRDLDEAPEPELMPGDELTEWSDDGGDTAEEVTWNELEERRGPGWLGREL